MSPIAIRSSPENPGNGITEFICFPVSWSIRFTVLLTPAINEELDAVIIRSGVGVGSGVGEGVGVGVGVGVGLGAGLGAGLGTGVVVSTVMEIVLEAVLALPAASMKVAAATLKVAVVVLFAVGVKVAV
jgi:hypothetical protein